MQVGAPRTSTGESVRAVAVQQSSSAFADSVSYISSASSSNLGLPTTSHVFRLLGATGSSAPAKLSLSDGFCVLADGFLLRKHTDKRCCRVDFSDEGDVRACIERTPINEVFGGVFRRRLGHEER